MLVHCFFLFQVGHAHILLVVLDSFCAKPSWLNLSLLNKKPSGICLRFTTPSRQRLDQDFLQYYNTRKGSIYAKLPLNCMLWIGRIIIDAIRMVFLLQTCSEKADLCRSARQIRVLAWCAFWHHCWINVVGTQSLVSRRCFGRSMENDKRRNRCLFYWFTVVVFVKASVWTTLLVHSDSLAWRKYVLLPLSIHLQRHENIP